MALSGSSYLSLSNIEITSVRYDTQILYCMSLKCFKITDLAQSFHYTGGVTSLAEVCPGTASKVQVGYMRNTTDHQAGLLAIKQAEGQSFCLTWDDRHFTLGKVMKVRSLSKLIDCLPKTGF
jgi:hypothetical protein